MTEPRPEGALRNPSPALGLSVLGLIAFVLGGSLLLDLPEATSAKILGLVLVGLGLFALMVGAVAVGVRLARSDR